MQLNECRAEWRRRHPISSAQQSKDSELARQLSPALDAVSVVHHFANTEEQEQTDCGISGQSWFVLPERDEESDEERNKSPKLKLISFSLFVGPLQMRPSTERAYQHTNANRDIDCGWIRFTKRLTYRTFETNEKQKGIHDKRGNHTFTHGRGFYT
jgi:hypothetical protein